MLVVRPANMIFEVEDRNGDTIWSMPHVPQRNSPNFCVIKDWIRNEEEWIKICKAGDPHTVDRAAFYEANFSHNKSVAGEFRDWKDLWGREEGKTCAMLCPGPSLLLADVPRDDNIFTMGLNRSIALKPDYYHALDRRGDPTWVVGDCPNTTFVGSTSVAHYATDNRFKEMYWGEFYATPDPSSTYPISMHLSISLANAMFIAYKLGAKQVDLYGCDFAMYGTDESDFSQKDVRYYFNGWMDDGLKLRPNTTPYPVQGIGDKLVFTTWELAVQAAHCTVMARMLVNNGVVVRNLTPRGILWDTWT